MTVLHNFLPINHCFLSIQYRKLDAIMLRVSDFPQTGLQQHPPWESCISYGWLLACTLKSTNTQLGGFFIFLISYCWFEPFGFIIENYCVKRGCWIGVMLLRLKHGVKVKEGLGPDVIGFSKILPLVQLLGEQPGNFCIAVCFFFFIVCTTSLRPKIQTSKLLLLQRQWQSFIPITWVSSIILFCHSTLSRAAVKSQAPISHYLTPFHWCYHNQPALSQLNFRHLITYWCYTEALANGFIFILPFLVFPFIHLNIIISATLILCICCFLIAHNSAPLNMTGLMARLLKKFFQF